MSLSKENISLNFDQYTSNSNQETESFMDISPCMSKSASSYSSETRQQKIDKYLVTYQEMPSSECLEVFREQQKSNYLKNLIRSFNRFILDEGDSVIIECLDIYQKKCAQFRQQFKKFIKRRNINNSLVKDLILNDRFGILFKYYLEVYAVDWLKQSLKIVDVRYHIFYIVFLLRSYSDSSLLDTIKFYSK
ncbi:hypothetical protein TTHERM_00469320 (macronuclear) [Tetrahymena thermophila SB210]|uniref:Uncharacterized protein n=1 Tax=Tetrahymena thermophila (strain SB210) TaxID=312017 RepID=I7MAM5_TETTS|nr:hypothetical protein TTHERM_00469320 [Tetrahymena thermophila SB210]EAS04883.2 hypothetical protein TTHERM_00469320 [Tetrahymena thermophila SB210]|eukprot:XP_001025128.2 hypothetical protein TTHERM_00469320 [Tetrahymena thermophila SB210]